MDRRILAGIRGRIGGTVGAQMRVFTYNKRWTVGDRFFHVHHNDFIGWLQFIIGQFRVFNAVF